MVKRDNADIFDKVFAQVDPIVAAGGFLAAAATSLGVPPPLTAIVGTVYDKEVQSDIVDILTWSPISQAVGIGLGENGPVSWADLFTGFYGPLTEDERSKARRKQGLILAAAFEGMLMMSLVRNETFLNKAMELGGKIASATITAAGEAVPF